MPDRYRITKGWAHRFAAEGISVPMLLRRAGLPASLFEQEKIYVTTAEVFAIWRTVAEMSRDPAFGLKLGTELLPEATHRGTSRSRVPAWLRRLQPFFRAFQRWEKASPSEWRSRDQKD